MKIRPHTFAPSFLPNALSSALAAELPPNLAPGTTFAVAFPELPPTFHAVILVEDVGKHDFPASACCP